MRTRAAGEGNLSRLFHTLPLPVIRNLSRGPPPACSSAPSVRFRKIPLRQKRGIKREPLICRLTGRNTAIFCTTRACLPESRAPLLKARGSSFHQKTLLFFLRPGRRTGSVSGKEYGEIFQPGQIPPSRIRGTMRKRSAPAPPAYTISTEKKNILTLKNTVLVHLT